MTLGDYYKKYMPFSEDDARFLQTIIPPSNQAIKDAQVRAA
jgi:hypothetical protein